MTMVMMVIYRCMSSDCWILFLNLLLILLLLCFNVLFMIRFYRISSVEFPRTWYLTESFCIYFDSNIKSFRSVCTHIHTLNVLSYSHSFQANCQLNWSTWRIWSSSTFLLCFVHTVQQNKWYVYCLAWVTLFFIE